jgi:hypothetical protein
MKHFLIPATIATILCGLIYATGQSIYRQSANDPQVQMAEDAIALIKSGKPIDPLTLEPKVNIAQSLAPYVIFYDQAGKPLRGSGEIDATLPTPPSGVFDAAKAKGENRITWQPKAGVRSAIVIRYFSNDKESGYVMAGRSLRETELRIAAFSQQVLIAWLVLLAVLAAESLAFGKIAHRKSH